MRTFNILLFVFLGIGFSSCKRLPPETRLYLSGDETSVSAKVYMDDNILVGIMTKQDTQDPEGKIGFGVFGEDIRFIEGKREPPYSGRTIIYVPNGKRKITIVTVDGKRYETVVDFQGGEMYGGVNKDGQLIIN